ncbi:hypothetical protein T439DRAFT_369105 [Meredithblackwellia eburnea MCA 4105]
MIPRRGAACSECRSRNRRCSGATAATFPCLTCVRAQRRCSGPAPSAPGAEAGVIKKLRKELSAPNSAGLTYTDKKLTSVQLSYALHYHLVKDPNSIYNTFLYGSKIPQIVFQVMAIQMDTQKRPPCERARSPKVFVFDCTRPPSTEHLRDSRKTIKTGPQERPKIEEAFAAVGRIDELSAIDELAIQSFAIQASYSSTHSALVGRQQTIAFAGIASPPSRYYIQVGFQRQFILKALQDRIFDLLMCTPLFEGTLEQSMDRLHLAYTLSGAFDDDVFSTSRLQIQRLLIRTGITLLEQNDSQNLRRHIYSWMSDIIRDEIVICLKKGRATTCSASLFRKIFPKTLLPFTGFNWLKGEDLALMRSTSTNPDAYVVYDERRMELYAPIVDTWDFCIGYLAFSRTQNLMRSLEKAWSLFAQSQACVEDYFEIIGGASTRPEHLTERETHFLVIGFVFEICGIDIFFGAHRLIERADLDQLSRAALLQLSRNKILAWMSQIVRHYGIVKTFNYSTIKSSLSIARKLALMFGAGGEDLFRSWRFHNPDLEELATDSLLYASFTGPSFAALAVRFDQPVLDRLAHDEVEAVLCQISTQGET